VPILGDAMWNEMWPSSSDRPLLDPDNNMSWDEANGMQMASIDRHNNQKNNWLLLDLSVSDVPIKELWQLNWHKKWIKENPNWSLYPWIK
jgi:hypothetical protein